MYWGSKDQHGPTLKKWHDNLIWYCHYAVLPTELDDGRWVWAGVDTEGQRKVHILSRQFHASLVQKYRGLI